MNSGNVSCAGPIFSTLHSQLGTSHKKGSWENVADCVAKLTSFFKNMFVYISLSHRPYKIPSML